MTMLLFVSGGGRGRRPPPRGRGGAGCSADEAGQQPVGDGTGHRLGRDATGGRGPQPRLGGGAHQPDGGARPQGQRVARVRGAAPRGQVAGQPGLEHAVDTLEEGPEDGGGGVRGGGRGDGEGVDLRGGGGHGQVDLDHAVQGVRAGGRAVHGLEQAALHVRGDALGHRQAKPLAVPEVPVEDRLRGARVGGDLVHGHLRAEGVHGGAGGAHQLQAALGPVAVPADAAAVAGGGVGLHGTERIRYCASQSPRLGTSVSSRAGAALAAPATGPPSRGPP